MRITLLTLCLFILGFLYPNFVFSADKPTITMIDEGNSLFEGKEVAGTYYNEIKRAFERNGRFKEVKLAKLPAVYFLDEERIKECKNNIREANKLFDDAKKDYENIDFANAIVKFQAAIRSFEQSFFCMENNGVLINSHLYLGLSYFTKGVKLTGYDSFKRALIINPGLSLNTKEFSPQIVMEFDAIKTEFLNEKKEIVTINVKPVGSSIFVNGNKIDNLKFMAVRGKYYVVAKMHGHISEVAVLNVGDGGTNSLNIQLRRLSDELSAYLTSVDEPTIVSNTVIQKLKQTCGYYNTDILLLRKVENPSKRYFNLSLQLFDCRVSEFSKIERQTLSIDDSKKYNEAAKKLMFCLSRDYFVTQNCYNERFSVDSGNYGDKGDEERELSSKIDREITIGPKSFYKTFWFWSLVTVFAVGAGVGGYFLYDRVLKNDEVPAEVMPDTGTLTITFPSGGG